MQAMAAAPRWPQLVSRPHPAAQLLPQRPTARRQPAPRLRWQPVTASFLSDLAENPAGLIAGTVLNIICWLGLESQTVRPAGNKWPSVEEGRARWQAVKEQQQLVDECKGHLANTPSTLHPSLILAILWRPLKTLSVHSNSLL